MKKIYSIITLAAATLTATAATPTAVTTTKATTAAPQVKEMKQAQPRLQVKNQITPAHKQTVYFDGEDAEVWTSLGTGKITAAFFEMFGIDSPTYPIEIEETPIEGGRKFRCLPFTHEDNPFVTVFDITDFDTENYMVFYAMDNGKNYFEDFEGHGIIPFSQYVAESGWQEQETGYKYATFDGESWTVPCGGVLADLSVINQGLFYGNSTTPLTIHFPGAKDYSCSIQTWICNEDIPGGVGENQVQAFVFQGAADAAYVKYGFVAGYWNFTLDKMGEFVGLYGSKIDSGKAWKCGVSNQTSPGIYTAYVGSFDENDQCKDVKSSYFFVLDDDKDNWAKVGTATWNESLYYGSYNNWTSQQLTMDYEEHKEIPGYYRLVNPYAAAMTPDGESLSAPCEGHNHYIYIDATVADQVKIEPSVTGSVYSGRGVVMSNGYRFEYSGNDAAAIKNAGYYGTIADNKITFPGEDVLLGEKDYANGAFYTTAPFEVTLTPDATGITLDKTQETLAVGETVTLTATVEPEGASTEGLVWTSSNELVATVDAEGVVTAVATGEAIITATLGELTAECTVTVEEASTPVEPSITLNETAVEVEVGKTVTLVATIENPLATDEVPTWSSSDETVATVDSEGVVTGVTVGTATITATYAGVTATCEVTVVDGNVMINEIIANGSAEAFDLQGRKINGNAKGLIIIRQGSKVSKAIVK